ncbi:hypothetical protein SARC_09249, partial [Sphaeroforma arctica JP610]
MTSCDNGLDLVFFRLVYFSGTTAPATQTVNIIHSGGFVDRNTGKFHLTYRTPLPARQKGRSKGVQSQNIVDHTRYNIIVATWSGASKNTNKTAQSSALEFLNWQWKIINSGNSVIDGVQPIASEKIAEWTEKNDRMAPTTKAVSSRCAT